jgi:hypothetical protein
MTKGRKLMTTLPRFPEARLRSKAAAASESANVESHRSLSMPGA